LLGDLAHATHMSPRTLERQFKLETGLSLRSFRRQARLLRSLELLSSDMSVATVSDKLGFGEPSAFIAMFRAAFGVTPGRYLARRRWRHARDKPGHDDSDAPRGAGDVDSSRVATTLNDHHVHLMFDQPHQAQGRQLR
jgi:AraC-like DNA-binding protein